MSYEGAGIYKHYKGGVYHVLLLALQEDTVRKPGQPEHDDAGPEVPFVIYQPLSPGSLLETRMEDAWARRLGDFNETVRVRCRWFPWLRRTVPRFRRIQG